MTATDAPFAVGFDFDHTLGLDNGLEATAFYRLGAELGHSVSDRDEPWHSFIAGLLGRFRAGVTTLDDAVGAFVTQCGMRADERFADRYRAICYGLVDELVTPIDGACELIAALDAREVPTAILTNGWSPLQHLKVRRALAFAGPVLVSDEVGILKPAAAAFGKLIDVLGVPRERVWFVGDNPKTDIEGAHDAGLRSVWFDWEHMGYPADAPPPDARIAHLLELLALLPGPEDSAENLRG